MKGGDGFQLKPLEHLFFALRGLALSYPTEVPEGG